MIKISVILVFLLSIENIHFDCITATMATFFILLSLSYFSHIMENISRFYKILFTN